MPPRLPRRLRGPQAQGSRRGSSVVEVVEKGRGRSWEIVVHIYRLTGLRRLNRGTERGHNAGAIFNIGLWLRFALNAIEEVFTLLGPILDLAGSLHARFALLKFRLEVAHHFGRVQLKIVTIEATAP